MLYDLRNPLDRERFKRRCNALYQKQGIVDLSEKTQRSIQQNKFLLQKMKKLFLKEKKKLKSQVMIFMSMNLKIMKYISFTVDVEILQAVVLLKY